MLKIKERGCVRHVSERAFYNHWQDRGYKIIEDLDAEEKLEDKTVDELRDIAKELELTGYYSLKKDELIAKIEKVE